MANVMSARGRMAPGTERMVFSKDGKASGQEGMKPEKEEMKPWSEKRIKEVSGKLTTLHTCIASPGSLKEQLRDMAATDIQTVDRGTLVDIAEIHVNQSLPYEERLREYLRQIRNPYCYLDGEIIVKISFAGTETTLEEKLMQVLRNTGS